MNPDRAIAVILTVSLAGVLLLGLYLLQRGRDGERPPVVASSDVPPAGPDTPVPSPTITAGPPPAARGYRLAGTVVGDLSYAIIVDPDGNNQLYRPGQQVADLGEVQTVEEDRVTLLGASGTFSLQLAPAPTETPTVARPTRKPTARATRAVTPARTGGRSASESSP